VVDRPLVIEPSGTSAYAQPMQMSSFGSEDTKISAPSAQTRIEQVTRIDLSITVLLHSIFRVPIVMIMNNYE
jgi:hypothetical protein